MNSPQNPHKKGDIPFYSSFFKASQSGLGLSTARMRGRKGFEKIA
jgi:hypothetical protein